VVGLADSGASEVPQDERRNRETVVVALDSDGKIDLKSMREKTKAKLRAAAEKTPELFPQAPKLPPFMIPGGLIEIFYAVLGAVETTIASKKFPEEIAGTFAFSDADIKFMLEPTQALAAKWVPKNLNRWKEEIDWVGAMMQLHFMKLRAAAIAMEQYEMARVKVNPEESQRGEALQ
jgi:hypothetical protein